jgi:hypothetical protein
MAVPAHLCASSGSFLPKTGLSGQSSKWQGAAQAKNTFQASGSLKFKQTTTNWEEGRDWLPQTREVPQSAVKPLGAEEVVRHLARQGHFP